MANPKPAGRLTACHRPSLGDFPPEGSVLQSGAFLDTVLSTGAVSGHNVKVQLRFPRRLIF